MTEPSQYFKGRTVQEQMNEVIGYVDVRSAEVATDAIAADVAQVHQDMLDADADAAAAAASAAAAAGTLANAVKKTGEASQSIAGDIAISGDVSVGGDLGVTGNLGVTGTATVPTPVNNTDAATKKYVDDADALLVPINNINQYAVGLTGNQSAAGIKTFTGMVVGRMGYRQRVTGTSKIEVCRTPDASDVFHLFLTINTRYASIFGRVNFTSDGAGNITGLYFGGLAAGSDGYTKIYVYKVDGNIIVALGNETSTNNYINFNVDTGFKGAGTDIAIDYSNVGRNVTSEVPVGATSHNLTV